MSNLRHNNNTVKDIQWEYVNKWSKNKLINTMRYELRYGKLYWNTVVALSSRIQNDTDDD
jgi:hypothetical protein